MNTLSLFALANRFMKIETKKPVVVEEEVVKESDSDESIEDRILPVTSKYNSSLGFDLKSKAVRGNESNKEKMKIWKMDYLRETD